MSVIIPEGHCYHCGLPNTEKEKFPVVLEQQTHFMCCPGCQAVAQSIIDNGLADYYRFRTETAEKGDEVLDSTLASLKIYDEPDLQEEFVFDEGKHKQIQLTVEGISCAACAWLIEKQLAKLDGIKQIAVNVSARRASVIWTDDIIKLSDILLKLKKIGYESYPFQIDTHENSYKAQYKQFLKKLGLAGLMTMQVMMLALGQYFDILGNIDSDAISYFNAISLILTTPVVLYSASVFYISASKAILARTVNMDVPITIAIFATYIAGVIAVNREGGEVYFESICMFVFFLLIGRFLEHRSRHKAHLMSSNMHKLIPTTAIKIDQQSGNTESVIAKHLQVNDIVLVKSGEIVPIDGEIIEGESALDESMLTGEFAPVSKRVGNIVYASSLNQHSPIKIKVTATLKYAMMNQIIQLQTMASASKPLIASFADRLSRYFVGVVLLIASISYAFWTLHGNDHAFWIMISILVATCPCALGLATPSALSCAMAAMQKQGLLVKRADVLEQITKVSDIVFDKTGTLTEGKFSIQKTLIEHDYINATFSKLIKSNKVEDATQLVHLLASSIEKYSEHPIALPFQCLSNRKLILDNVKVTIGGGVSAVYEGLLLKVGSQAFMQSDPLKPEFDGANVYLSINDNVIAAFWVTDTIKPNTKEIIANISNKEISILSGDTQQNVDHIAQQLNIQSAYGNKTPDSKLAHIQILQSNSHRIMMLGDGINDAPVLAAADVSVAVGNASDLAKNAADVIILNSNLRSLNKLIALANQTKKIIKQNVAWSLGYNCSVLPFAILGWLTPWQAALGMSLSSIIVVYNSTRLLTSKEPQ